MRESTEPAPLGGEVAGTVAAVGEGVIAFAAGDRVTGLCFSHAYAEPALVHQTMASRIPDRATAVDAVALVRSGLVARGAYEAGSPSSGDTVLVTAAASAVGTLALQYAKAGGASRVVAAVSSANKAEFVHSLGADEVVLYEDESWGDPVDIVLDGVGGELLGPAVRTLAPGGRLVAFSSGGGMIDAYELLVRGASVVGFQMAAIACGKPEQYARWRDELWELHRTSALRTRVHAQIPFAQAAHAHEIIESAATSARLYWSPGSRPEPADPTDWLCAKRRLVKSLTAAARGVLLPGAACFGGEGLGMDGAVAEHPGNHGRGRLADQLPQRGGATVHSGMPAAGSLLPSVARSLGCPARRSGKSRRRPTWFRRAGSAGRSVRT